MTTTCQLCAREIKAARGLIAHHGYLRPGHGWQTSSCYGAKRLPYEHADGYDAILEGIEQNKRYVAYMRALADKHLAGEGEILRYVASRRGAGWYSMERYFEVMCPYYKADRVKQEADRARKEHGAHYRATYAKHLRAEARRVEDALPNMQARYDNHPTIKARRAA